MPNEPKRMYQRWTCDKCQLYGTVEHWSNEDALTIMSYARDEHERLSPGCQGRLRFASTSAPVGAS